MKSKIDELKLKIEFDEKTSLAQKGNALKRSILMLNTVYGKLGEIQAELLNELNILNNSNLNITNERMQEALKVVNQLLPLNTED